MGLGITGWIGTMHRDHRGSAAPAGFDALQEIGAYWVARALNEFETWVASVHYNPGHGQGGTPVLVLPGLGMGDGNMVAFREMLKRRGYWPTGWGMGLNRGYSLEEEGRLVDLVREVHRVTGERVSVIGWSMGGAYARAIAQQAPECVRQVISLGTPFKDLESTTPALLYERATGQRVIETFSPAVRRRLEEIGGDIPVPFASIFSRHDGIAAWEACYAELDRDRRCQSIEVDCQHFSLPHSLEVFEAVERLLARPEDEWEPDPLACGADDPPPAPRF